MGRNGRLAPYFAFEDATATRPGLLHRCESGACARLRLFPAAARRPRIWHVALWYGSLSRITSVGSLVSEKVAAARRICILSQAQSCFPRSFFQPSAKRAAAACHGDRFRGQAWRARQKSGELLVYLLANNCKPLFQFHGDINIFYY